MLTQQEYLRQLLHIVIGVITVVLIYFHILTPFAIFLLIIVGVIASFLSKRTYLPFFTYFLNNLERENQRDKFPGKGLIFYFVGVLLVIKLFDTNIALASIMILAFGDSISHMVGRHFGRIKNIFNGNSRKLLEGTVAGTLAGFLGALVFVPIAEAFLGSLVAMIAEVIKIDFNEKPLDDNFIVPLVAGTTMLLVGQWI